MRRWGAIWLGICGALAAGVATAQAAESPILAAPLVVVGESPRVGIGDTMTVQFQSLDNWSEAAPGSDPLQAVLFIDGYPIRGVKPDRRGNALAFHLVRADSPEARETWAEIVHGIGGFSRMMSLGVGLADGRILAWGAPFELSVVPSHTRAVLGFLLLIAALVALFVLTRRSNILRDPRAVAGEGGRASFSLARSQMAFWFVVVLLSYLYLWVVTGERDTLPVSVIALLGISAATALGGVVVDDPKNKVSHDEMTKLQQQKAQVRSRLSALRGQLAALTAPTDALQRATCAQAVKSAEAEEAALESRLAVLSSHYEASGSFLRDVLSDDRGISLSRFQMLIWTLVLGVVFVVSVRTDLAMPDLSGTLLALLGVSSGTYVGLKVPEGSP